MLRIITKLNNQNALLFISFSNSSSIELLDQKNCVVTRNATTEGNNGVKSNRVIFSFTGSYEIEASWRHRTLFHGRW